MGYARSWSCRRRFALTAGLLWLLSGIAGAQAPDAVSYQGLLLDPSGAPINGSVDVDLGIWSDPTSTSPADLLYGESHAGETVVDGVFAVEIGRGAPLSGSFATLPLATSALWVEVSVDGETLSPRQEITSSFYALHAEMCSDAELLQGSSPADFLPATAQTLETLACAAGEIPRWNGATWACGVDDDVPDGDFEVPNTITVGPGSLVQGADIIISPVLRDAIGSVAYDPSARTLQVFNGPETDTFYPGKRPPGVIVVEPGGDGDFTTIQAALDSVTPSPTEPYIIDVRPGLYVESVRMKSHVHLRGASPETTVIRPTATGGDFRDFIAVTLENLTDVRISGFTITQGGVAALAAGPGIYDLASSPVIENNRFEYFAGNQIQVDLGVGVYSESSAPQIIENRFVAGADAAIQLVGTDAMVMRNVVTADPQDNGDFGVLVEGGSVQIVGNRIVGQDTAIGNSGPSSGPTYHVVVQANVLESNANGLSFETGSPESTAVVVGNRADGGGVAGGSGIRVGPAGRWIVMSNAIAGHDFGISVALSTQIPPQIVSNQIREPAIRGLSLPPPVEALRFGNWITNSPIPTQEYGDLEPTVEGEGLRVNIDTANIGPKGAIRAFVDAAGDDVALYGEGPRGIGVLGESGPDDAIWPGGNIGVFGASLPDSGFNPQPVTGDGYGVYGRAEGATIARGGYFEATDAVATENYGVHAVAANGAENWAGRFDGDVQVNGVLSSPTVASPTGTVGIAGSANVLGNLDVIGAVDVIGPVKNLGSFDTSGGSFTVNSTTVSVSSSGLTSFSAGGSTITLDPTGVVTIQSASTLRVQSAGVLELSGNSVSIDSATSVAIQAATEVDLTAGALLDLNGGALVDMDAVNVDVDASNLIQLN